MQSLALKLNKPVCKSAQMRGRQLRLKLFDFRRRHFGVNGTEWGKYNGRFKPNRKSVRSDPTVSFSHLYITQSSDHMIIVFYVFPTTITVLDNLKTFLKAVRKFTVGGTELRLLVCVCVCVWAEFGLF